MQNLRPGCLGRCKLAKLRRSLRGRGTTESGEEGEGRGQRERGRRWLQQLRRWLDQLRSWLHAFLKPYGRGSRIRTGPQGDQASARSYYTVLQATDALPLQPIISGRYRDQFQKRDGSWGFTSREMIVDLIGNCSEHLLYEAQGLDR